MYGIRRRNLPDISHFDKDDREMGRKCEIVLRDKACDDQR
jgi:hypothetical protein